MIIDNCLSDPGFVILSWGFVLKNRHLDNKSSHSEKKVRDSDAL
jgi:hypothetical protein